MASIFDSPAQAVVVPVNTVGAMGAGLALAAHKQYGDKLYNPYRAACVLGYLETGDEGVAQAMTVAVNSKSIILAPTKEHWRDRSHLTWVRGAMAAIIREVIENNITAVAIPALGCGEGGLDWNEVRPIIAAGAERLRQIGVKVEVFDTHEKSETFMPTTPGEQPNDETAQSDAIPLPGGYFLVTAHPLPSGALDCGRHYGAVGKPGDPGQFGSSIVIGKSCPRCKEAHQTAAETLPCYEAGLRARLNKGSPEFDPAFRAEFMKAMSSYNKLACPGCYERESKLGHSGDAVICHTRVMAEVFSNWRTRCAAQRTQ